MTTYSTELQSFIKNPSTEIPSSIEFEIRGFLGNRPVVILKNNTSTLCYYRPGVAKAIQAAFVRTMRTVDMPKTASLNAIADDFSDLSKPLRCTKNPDDLFQLYTLCERIGLLYELYMEIIANDTDYFQQIVNTSTLRFSPLGLEECACKNNKNNRIFTDSRYRFENLLVDHIRATVPQNECVKVLSLGSGKLLQDWKSIGLLIKEGYTKFEWILVDPINSKGAPVTAFKEFYTKLPTISMQIRAYDRLSEVPKTELHAVAVVDPPRGIFNDMISILDYLAPTGKMIEASASSLYEISSYGVTVVYQPKQCISLCQDICNIIPNDHTATIKLAIFDHWLYGLSAINALKTQGIKQIHLLMDDEEEKQHYTTLFPTISFTIEQITEEEFEARIKTAEHFDLILTVPPDENTQQELEIEKWQKAASHTLGQTSTTYLIGNKSTAIFRWNKKTG